MQRIKKRYWHRWGPSVHRQRRKIIERETAEEQIDRLLRTRQFWKRHPEPFNKRRAGRMRRAERRFTMSMSTAMVDNLDHGAH